MQAKTESEIIHSKHTYIRHELANATTHGIGALLFVLAVPVLVSYAITHSSVSTTLCTAIFGLCLMITYLSSTLYHAIQHTEAKRILRIFDHVSIFLLIGGSYTPIIYHYMPEHFSVPFLLVLWFVVFVGCIFKVFYTGRFRLVSTFIYVALGGMVLFIIKPLTASMTPTTIELLVGGGIFYAGGVPFYIMKQLRYNHAIWHVFVLAGSISHFCVVFNSIS